MNELISIIVPCYNQAEYMDECLQSAGAPDWDDADYKLATDFLRSYSKNTLANIREALTEYFAPNELDEALMAPLDKAVHPFNPRETGYESGSTDVGDVGYVTPTVMLHVATACLGNVGHTWQNTAFSCSAIGMKGMLRAAQVMALACVRTMEQPALIEQAKREVAEKNGGRYVCPLPEYVQPPIGTY